MQNHRALFKYAGKSIFVPAVLTLLRSFFSSVLLVLVSKQIVEAVVTKDVRDLVLLVCALGAVLLMIAWTNAAYKRSGVVKKSLATNCQESFELETFHRVRVFASERR